MGRVYARLLLTLYRRRLRRMATAGARRHVPVGLVPRVPAGAASDCVLVGSSVSTRAALVSTFNCEEQLPFMGVALQHYFGAVARAWVGDPLGCITRRALTVPLLCTDVGELARASDDEALPAVYMSLAGQWLPFVQATGWQPGILVEDARDVRNFWSARGRMIGQARVSQILAGYYLSMLHARFRCRVGMHIGCMPGVRRGDSAFVRLSMVRWHWTACWGGSRDLMSGALLSALLCLRACDTRGLARVLRFLLVCAGYFRHRALLVFLQRFLSAALDLVSMSSDVRGIVLQLRGKIGRRGLARKSKYVISCGLPRPTGDSPRILWDYTQATTITGVLGLNLALVF